MLPSPKLTTVQKMDKVNISSPLNFSNQVENPIFTTTLKVITISFNLNTFTFPLNLDN